MILYFLLIQWVFAQNITETVPEIDNSTAADTEILNTTEAPLLTTISSNETTINQTEATVIENVTLPIIEFDKNLTFDELSNQINNLFNAMNVTLPVVDANLTIAELDFNETTVEPTTIEPTTTTTTTTTTTVYVGCIQANHTCNFRNGSTFSKADCSFQDLSRIPCGLGNITILNMKSNYVNELTMGQLDELTDLNKLELDNNGLKRIRKYDDVEWPLKKLETLSISTSHLVELRDFMHTGLVSLQNLNYAYGAIERITENAFAGLPQLKAFWAPENRIEHLPDHLFRDSPNLEQINLKQNKIQSFTNTTFAGLSAIVKIDLEDNQIEQIPAFSFNDTVKLEELILYKVNIPTETETNLVQNNLRNITATAFVGCRSLTKLDLSNNNITVIDADAFVDMTRLRTLYLEKNSIHIIHAAWFHPSLIKVQIAENTWDCGCDHAEFRHALEDATFAERFESLVDEPVLNCTTPPQMLGHNLAAMNITWFPAANKTCLTPTTIWGTEQFRENRRSDLNLTCDIGDGYPQPLFNWTLPGGETRATATSNWLVIENLNDKDAGDYVCSAMNIAGVATQRFYVTVSYECGVYDELGNMIAIDEDCNSGNTQPNSQQGGAGGVTGSSFVQTRLDELLVSLIFVILLN